MAVTRWRHWVGIVEDGGCERVGFGVVDHAQIDRRQTPRINLGMAGHCMCVVMILFHCIPRIHSFRVIPGTIPAEFEFHLKFRQNHLINLAGPSAKFDSSGIPGIAWILPDSGQNQWRTIKTSLVAFSHRVLIHLALRFYLLFY